MRSGLRSSCGMILLGLGVLLGTPGMAGDAQHSSWYVGAGIGANWMADMNQSGWNRDTICYPDWDCSNRASIDGYRWFYDLDADRGNLFELVIGRGFGNVRLEVSANRRENDIDQKFADITYFDGSQPQLDSMSNYTSQSEATMDRLRTQTLQLNAYYDFPQPDYPVRGGRSWYFRYQALRSVFPERVFMYQWMRCRAIPSRGLQFLAG